jgi:rhodanese-related sulfurtransferase
MNNTIAVSDHQQPFLSDTVNTSNEVEITMKLISREVVSCGHYFSRLLSAKGITMKLICREELKEKLDKGEDVKLVFVLGEWQYRAKHIPGSLNLYTLEEALKLFDQDDEIVVYCSNEACHASFVAYHFLLHHGFKNVRRYVGGLQEWEDAGYPLEGEMAAAAQFAV